MGLLDRRGSSFGPLEPCNDEGGDDDEDDDFFMGSNGHVPEDARAQISMRPMVRAKHAPDGARTTRRVPLGTRCNAVQMSRV